MQRWWSFRSSDGWWRCLCWGTLWRCLSMCTHDEWSQLTGVCLGCIWREEWEHLHGPGSSSTATCSRCGHRGTFWTGLWLSWLGDKESASMRSCTHDLVICNMGHGKFLLKHAAHTDLDLLSHPSEPRRWQITPVSKISLDGFLVLHSKHLRLHNGIKTVVLHLWGHPPENQDPNKKPLHFKWVLPSTQYPFGLERWNTWVASSPPEQSLNKPSASSTWC